MISSSMAAPMILGTFHITHAKRHVTQPRKYHETHIKNYHVVPPIAYNVKPKFNQNLRRTNKKGPKKMWVPKKKTISFTDSLGNKEDKSQHVKSPGLKLVSTLEGKKDCLPSSDT